MPQPQQSAGTSSEKKLHIFRRCRWTQLNHIISSEVRIGEQDKSKKTGALGGHEILIYICVTFECLLCRSDIIIELQSGAT